MNIILLIIKLLASSGILFAYYWLFLRNRKFHRYNRFYLLGAVLISMVLPFLKIDIFLSPTAPANKVILDTLEVITVNAGEEEVVLADAGTSWLDWFNSTTIMWGVYIIGAIVFLSLLIRSIIYIRKIQRNYPVEKIEDLKFYNTAEPGTPFSFFRSIFWNNKVEFNSSEGQQIFRHELFHVRQKHSADLLFMEIVMLFAWFNPFFYLIKKELKAIHEFLADEYAVSNSDEYEYAELLVLFALHEKQNKLVHPLFHNTIKRRIAMITNLKNKKVGYWGRVMALPLSLLLFSFIVLKAQKTEIPEDKANEHVNIEVAIQPITVVIDAAHGGSASGALSNDRNIYEKDINLAIANKIAALAPSYNINIILTRNNDNTITAQDRIALMNTAPYDLLVSIHVNAANVSREPKPDYPNKSGFEVYVSRNNTSSSNKSEILARHLITKLEPLYKTYNKTKIREYESIYILDKGQKPSALVECGYITNNKDLTYITNPTNQENIAKKILEGIVAYSNSSDYEKTKETQERSAQVIRSNTFIDTVPGNDAVQKVITFKRPAKKSPTQHEWETWKDEKTYGIWLDGKRTKNEILNKHSTNEFSWYMVSKLAKNAINYGNHYYQVDLYSHDYYKKCFPNEIIKANVKEASTPNEKSQIESKNSQPASKGINSTSSLNELPDSVKRYIMRHFNKNIHFPIKALDSNKEGTIYFSVLIDKNGSFSNIEKYTSKPNIDEKKINEIVVTSITEKPWLAIKKADPSANDYFYSETERVIQKFKAPENWKAAYEGSKIYIKITFIIEKIETAGSIKQSEQLESVLQKGKIAKANVTKSFESQWLKQVNIKSLKGVYNVLDVEPE